MFSQFVDCFEFSWVEIVPVHEDDERKRSDHEILFADEKRRRRMRSLRKKAISASNRITHTLKKHSKRLVHCRFESFSAEEFLDEVEEKAVDALRNDLIEKDLLPVRHDDYHTLLRSSSTFFDSYTTLTKFCLIQFASWWNKLLLSSGWCHINGITCNN